MTLWALLGAPLALVLVLVGIHTYLGLHVLRRGVIFVDLALAQVAAVGALVAFIVGLAPGSLGASAFALVFALVGAGLLSVLRLRPDSAVPKEALIGLVYAFAAALGIVVMSKAPEGAEHLRETVAGSLLWVKWSTVVQAVLVNGAIAAVHYAFRKPILAVSESAHDGSVPRQQLWDFVFYGTFAVVVTQAVATAGVLLVFVFLVAPATLAMLFFRSLRAQLLFGWGLGVVVCALAMGVSYLQDLPAAPTVVTVYAVALATVGAYRWCRPEGRWSWRRPAGGIATLAVAATALVTIHYATNHYATGNASTNETAHGHDHHAHDDQASEAHAHEHHAREQVESEPPGKRAQDEALLARVVAADLPDEKRAACADERSTHALVHAFELAAAPFDRLALAQCLEAVDPAKGHEALEHLAHDDALPQLVRDQAADAVIRSHRTHDEAGQPVRE